MDRQGLLCYQKTSLCQESGTNLKEDFSIISFGTILPVLVKVE